MSLLRAAIAIHVEGGAGIRFFKICFLFMKKDSTLNRNSLQSFTMHLDMVFDEGGDREITVVVALVVSVLNLEFLIANRDQVGREKILQELVVQTLIDQDFKRRPRIGLGEFCGIVFTPCFFIGT